ncbi:MAG: hypothetical protein F9K19_00905 [Rhizobiaceae bacterium]|nr:MAG: hypothetical protein F9K19_00905 [Rhizobiaceae bacterium]
MEAASLRSRRRRSVRRPPSRHREGRAPRPPSGSAGTRPRRGAGDAGCSRSPLPIGFRTPARERKRQQSLSPRRGGSRSRGDGPLPAP